MHSMVLQLRVNLNCSHYTCTKELIMRDDGCANYLHGDYFTMCIYIYQITWYTLNIYNYICQLFLNKAEKINKKGV